MQEHHLTYLVEKYLEVDCLGEVQIQCQIVFLSFEFTERVLFREMNSN